MTLIKVLPILPPIEPSTSNLPTDVPTGSISSVVSPLGLYIFNGSGWSEIGGSAGSVTSLIGTENQILFNGVTSPQTGDVTASLAPTVVIGTGIADTTSILTLNSTTLGLLPPRLTTTQKNAIVSPTAGLTLYDTTVHDLQFYNGSTWISSSGTTAIIGTANQVLANGTSGSSQTGSVTLTLQSVVRVTSQIGIMPSGTPTYDMDIVLSKSGSTVVSRVENSSAGAASDALFYAQTVNGDAYLLLQTASISWTAGLDISDSSKFKIGNAGAVGTNDMFVIASSTFTANILALSGAHYGALKLSGTVTLQDGSGIQYGSLFSNTFSPAANTQATVQIYSSGVVAVAGGVTVTKYIDILSSPSFTGHAGAITDYYAIRFDGGTSVGAGGTVVNAYGGFFQRPLFTGSTTTTALYAADLVIGSVGTNPPSSGLYVSTAITIGGNAQANTQITLNATGQYGIFMTSTMSQASVDLYSILVNNIMSPSTTNNVYGIAYKGVFNSVSGRTIPNAYAYFSDLNITASGGTVTNSFHYYAGGGTNTASTLTNVYGFYSVALTVGTNRWGGYFNAPSGGTIAIALYAANLSVGYSTTAAPAGGAIFSGSVSIGSTSTTSMFNVGSGNNFQVDSNGNVGINGIVAGARIANSGTTTATTGNISQLYIAGSLGASSGTVGTASYVYCYPNFGANVTTITNACGICIDSGNATGTVTTGYGILVNAIGYGTSRYGLWIAPPTGGTNNYGGYIGGTVGLNRTPTLTEQIGMTLTKQSGIYCDGTISTASVTHQMFRIDTTSSPSSNSMNSYCVVLGPTFNSSSSGINATSGLLVSPIFTGTGTINQFVGVDVDIGSIGSGNPVINTNYGVYVAGLGVGVTRIGLYVATPSASGATSIAGSYLGYPVSIGDQLLYEASKITLYVNRSNLTAATGNVYQAYIQGSMGATSTNTVSEAVTLYLNPDVSANAGTVSGAYGILISGGNSAATVNLGYGIYVVAPGYGVTRYSLYCENPTGGTTNYGAFIGGISGFGSSPLVGVGINLSYGLTATTGNLVGTRNSHNLGASSGTVANAYNNYSSIGLTNNVGTVTNACSIFVDNGASAGTVTNGYGLYIAPQLYATNRVGLYVAAPTGGTLNYGFQLFGQGAFNGTPTTTALISLVASSTYNNSLYITGTLSPASAAVRVLYIDANITPAAANDANAIYSNPTITSGASGLAVCKSIYTSFTFAGTGTVTESAGIYVDTCNGGGSVTVTTHSGLKINSQNVGTTRYGLYVAGQSGGTTNVCAYFAGPIQFGTVSTGAKTVNLGTNAPAGIGTLTPNTWITVITAAGTTAYVPCWA